MLTSRVHPGETGSSWMIHGLMDTLLNPSHQIISIYYFAKSLEPFSIEFKNKPFDFAPHQIADPNGESEVFRLIEWDEFNEDIVNLPIDKIAVRTVRSLISK